MKNKFLKVKVCEFLKRVERFEQRQELEEYQFSGTYSFGRGIFVGEKKLGSTFKLNKIQRIHEGDFVYCKIMAWEGAFGLVPKEAHNCVMSGAFVTYEIDESIINPRYLAYYFKIESVWKLISSRSTGTNIRRQSLHPKEFENTTIPLPPLEEQRRIVARVEEMVGKIEEVRSLRQKALEEAEALRVSSAKAIFDELTQVRTQPLGDLVTVQGGGTPSKQNPLFWDGSIPWISPKDMKSREICNSID